MTKNLGIKLDHVTPILDLAKVSYYLDSHVCII